jgi:hypothetical protein
MRLRAISTVLGCFLTVFAVARQANATPVVTLNPADLAGTTLIDFEDLLSNPITNQYAALGVTFSGGLHSELAFGPIPEWGIIAATNSDGTGGGSPITMSFSSPLKAFGFQIITLDPAVTTLNISTLLNGVSNGSSQVVINTSSEVKFFGLLSSPANELFDSIVIETLLPPDPGVPSGFVFDNLQFQAVPEPASLTLLATGAMGLIARARRARRNSADRSAC